MVLTPEIGGGIFIIVNVLVFWFREWLKHRTWNKNGKDLAEIKADVKDTNEKIDAVDGKVGETNLAIAKIKTAVNAQKTQCAATIQRFDKAIGDQNQHIINLTGRKR